MSSVSLSSAIALCASCRPHTPRARHHPAELRGPRTLRVCVLCMYANACMCMCMSPYASMSQRVFAALTSGVPYSTSPHPFDRLPATHSLQGLSRVKQSVGTRGSSRVFDLGSGSVSQHRVGEEGAGRTRQALRARPRAAPPPPPATPRSRTQPRA
eukprot:218469-Rhodomonas_salina.2